ncbi:CmcJ/NvfI family oxidoreductase [Bradyrhizobium sp. LLZ17]|uniref:CmcJ/NvfI family oxidoreductase n=1 Tax=Bradyrhizobium sp. LLZ17 TaxID=3239388 RepID=A0AB39XUK4_9BRAD
MRNKKPSAPSTEATRDCLEYVKGQINFARRTSDEPAPEADLLRRLPDMLFGHIHEQPPLLSYDITIRNARPIVNQLSLEREGFTLVQRELRCLTERDPEILYDRYLEEMVPYIKKSFDASWVEVRRQTLILRSAAGSSAPTMKEPIALAHTDYAPIAGPVVAAIASQSQGIPVRSYSRLMIIQTWHALSPPPQDFPLAICDGASVRDSDIDVVDYTVHNYSFKMGIVRFNPAQRWYYFPEMTTDEFILFKSYDSDARCNPQTPHSAFDNRRAHPSARARESLEARFFVYYA